MQVPLLGWIRWPCIPIILNQLQPCRGSCYGCPKWQIPHQQMTVTPQAKHSAHLALKWHSSAGSEWFAPSSYIVCQWMHQGACEWMCSLCMLVCISGCMFMFQSLCFFHFSCVFFLQLPHLVLATGCVACTHINVFLEEEQNQMCHWEDNTADGLSQILSNIYPG